MKIDKGIWKRFGPGIITGASDDDPSGIATYSQAGAQFGLATLWTAVLTFPLMSSIQEICARIGAVTGTGLIGVLKTHYPKPISYLMLLFSFPAIVLNIGADISAMGAVANLVFPNIRASYFCGIFTALLLFLIIKLQYRTMARILRYLCVCLMVYILVPFIVGQQFGKILPATLIPTIRFDKDFLAILVAILGTTISPYLFFWQATMEVEELKHAERKIVVNKRLIQEIAQDVNLGMFFSNLVMWFIILTAGTVLFRAGIHRIETVEQAARALQPLAGNYASLLFSLGVIATGMLAIPVLSGSLSYIVCETFDWKEGLDYKFHEAKPFYIIIIASLIVGLFITYLGISPIRSLIYAAVLYGVTAPVLIAIILHISNNKKIMGKFTNNTMSNVLGIITLILMTTAAFLMFLL
ncbi:NRAMP family divalent metal transporter [Pedobacter ureilyticus]|uniref:NRAMP family divalent metal transporter n=1 Tax=Pedobacter ureilyticus TaxID=1393051 RepID=A0ABW9JBU5_9SPHI|nr:divalent metal cation transporter [Pedobacter helvus]